MFFIQDVSINCINQAARTYLVPAKIIIAILRKEGGVKGLAKLNKNGSVDYGPMQINSSWLKTLEPLGYTKQMLQYNPCINVRVGTWILSQNIANARDYWQGVGNYHSHTLKLNENYQQKIKIYYKHLKINLS